MSGIDKEPEKKPWWRFRRVDLIAALGAVGFIAQIFAPGPADPTLVYASLALLGIPLVARLDDRCKH